MVSSTDAPVSERVISVHRRRSSIDDRAEVLDRGQASRSAYVMDTGVVAALVAAGASLIVAIIGAALRVKDRRQGEALAQAQGELQRELAQLGARLDREARQEERELSAREELERVREPLLAAALDLAHRLDNIRHGAFLDLFLGEGMGHRDRVARLSTHYRFARYWCIVEALYDRVALPRFLAEESTQQVGAMLNNIGKTCAQDGYDARRFMMWREEQRAIAELMRDRDTDLGCMGFATFVRDYEEKFSRWFGSFDEDLKPAAARQSKRLDGLQHLLAVLAQQLDRRQLYLEDSERLLRQSSWPALLGTTAAAPSP
jgi:hypothetical protein